MNTSSNIATDEDPVIQESKRKCFEIAQALISKMKVFSAHRTTDLYAYYLVCFIVSLIQTLTAEDYPVELRFRKVFEAYLILEWIKESDKEKIKRAVYNDMKSVWKRLMAYFETSDFREDLVFAGEMKTQFESFKKDWNLLGTETEEFRFPSLSALIKKSTDQDLVRDYKYLYTLASQYCHLKLSNPYFLISRMLSDDCVHSRIFYRDTVKYARKSRHVIFELAKVFEELVTSSKSGVR